jgi:DUF1365 family protein
MRSLSALYVGEVMHRRLRPVAHRFRYRAFWLLLDLDQPPRLRLFSQNRFNLFALHDTDHGDGSSTPLRVQAERMLSQAGIDLAGGPIRLLCMPRTLGYNFNPLSIYYCHRAGGELAALIYQVHNTFGERHCYVAAVETESGDIRQNCRKAFYVSPFMDMEMAYDFRLAEPDERLAIRIGASQNGHHVFSAALAARRRELDDRALLSAFLSLPLITLKVTLAIHWEALRLWLKGVRLRVRPPPPAHHITLAATTSKPRIDSHAA